MNATDAAVPGPVDLPGVLRLSAEEKAYLLRACRIALENSFSRIATDAADFENVPGALRSADAKIFVTLYTAGKTRGCQSAQAGDLLSSAIVATTRSVRDSRFGERLRRRDLADTYININVLEDGEEVSCSPGDLSRHIELGVHSVSLDCDGSRAFFKNSVPISKGYGMSPMMRRLSRKAGLESDAYKRPDATIRRYVTHEFAEDFRHRFSAPSLVDYYRGFPVVQMDAITRARLEESLRLSATYFVRHTTGRGRVTYEYEPSTDERSYSAAPVAVLRRAAGTWVMAELAVRLQDPALRRATTRSLGYLMERHFTSMEGKPAAYMQVRDNVNVGLAGFTLLAILTLADTEHEESGRQLAAFICEMEDREGGYLAPVLLPKRSDATDGKHHYYPGEAMTALLRMANASKDSQYSDVVARVFPFYRDFYRNSDQRVNMSAWMSKPYAALFTETKERPYADFVFEINDHLVGRQSAGENAYNDRAGAFSKRGNSCASGVFLESVAEGLDVALQVGDEQRIARYRSSLYSGMRFLLQSQISMTTLSRYPWGEAALGGYRTDFFNPAVRIDNVQHCALATMRALDLLELRY